MSRLPHPVFISAITPRRTDDGIRERVRVIEAKHKDQHARIWTVEEDGEGG